MSSLTPGQMVIKIVNEEMVSLMGSETTEIKLKSGNEITVIMMAGLQGAGKTTTTAKLAGKFKEKGKKPLLVACDVYRPAAIEQLTINGNKQGVEVFSMGTGHNPVDIAKASIKHARDNNYNIVILDTAGRLHVDENMMEELINIKNEVQVDQTILVVDSMTGQDAVNVAASFNEKVGIDGVILTKLDGDTRGGAALSIKAVTGKPILYVGMGEKLSDLEQFYPDRMASRILGMGDVLTLIEKAEAQIDADKAKEIGSQLSEKNACRSSLEERQLERLRKIGFKTEKKTVRQWNEKYALAKDYYEEYGNLNVPVSYSVNGVKLGRWISNIRAKRKHPEGSGMVLDEYRIRQLDSIGMDWK